MAEPCPCCRKSFGVPGQLVLSRNSWSGTDRAGGNPAKAILRLGLNTGWIDRPYRLRIPTGHVSVAEPAVSRIGSKTQLSADLDLLAEFGWSYVISEEQAMHWAGGTVSVQLYPKGVHPINLKEFWLRAIGKES